MTAITPETRHAIEQAGEQPVQLTDPETKSVYVIVRADVYGASARCATTSTYGMRTH